MPIFDVELSDGRTVTLESDHEPSDDEVLSSVGSAATPPPFPEKRFPQDYSPRELKAIELERQMDYERMEPRPTAWTGFKENLNDVIGDVGRGFLRFIPSAMKTAGVVASDTTAFEVDPFSMAIVPRQEQPPQAPPEQHPLYRAGVGVEDFLSETFPPPQEPELSRSVAEGFGQMGSMVGAGGFARVLGAGAPAVTATATALGGVQEFDDAFTRSRQRGDDPDTAFAKSLGYATVAGLIENKLGAGRILRQLMPSAKDAVKRLTALGVSRKILGNFVAGGAEEGSQRLAQNWIVEGEPSLEGVKEEALPGAIVQGITGLPGAGVTRAGERTPDALQQKAEGAVRDVQQPPIPQEGAKEVPAPVSGGEIAEARVELTPQEVKQKTINDRVKAGIKPENIFITVNKDPAVPGFGYVQVDEFNSETKENVFSSNVKQLTEAGLSLPAEAELMSLPSGKYTLNQAKELLAAQKKGGEPSVQEEKVQEEVVAEPLNINRNVDAKLPDDLASLNKLQAEVSSRLDEIYASEAEAFKGTQFEGQSRWSAIQQTLALLTDINTKISNIKAQPKTAEPVPMAEGMGPASAGFTAPVKPFTTSNKNAVVDQERKERGLPPMMDLARQGNQDAWDSAMRQVDENPQVQDELIAELAAKPRALTATENAMLMHRRIDLRNEYEKTLVRWREAFESDDLLRASEESQRVKDWSSKLADLEDITKATGAESGRSLQARKMMANEDFTLATMEMQAMEAKGQALTVEERMELIRAHEKIAALQAKLDELESRRESVEVEKTTDQTIKEVAKDAPAEAKSKDFDIDREENLLGGIKAKVDKGQVNEITPLVQKLARVFWRRGIRQREPMIDALHETLKTIIPTFTRDDTKRAFSGYGNFTPLSKESIDVGLRDLRGQTQQVLKMEAIEARKPLEKTGQERRVPSDEERRLIKQVNELKRRFGVVVTDPETQLKSALAARKTYYEHRIADLQHEINTRQRIVKTKTPSPTDPELQRLIEEVERLKAEHAQIFTRPQMTDEQRLKVAMAAAERNLAHWNVRLDNAEKGVFDKRQPGRKVTSPELELIQAEAAAIREHVKELHDLDAAVVAEKREKSLQAKKETLEKQIAELERKLATGDLTSPQSQPANRPADPALELLLQERDRLNDDLKAARKEAAKKPEAQKYAEAQERQLGQLHKRIQERLDKIAAGDITPAAKKVNRPLSPELEQAKQALEAVNKQMADMRRAAKPKKSKEEIALQSLKTRMANRIADLKRRIATGDFTKKERVPVKLDPEAAITKAQLEQLKQEYEAGLERDRWAKMSVFQKTKRKTADIYDAARALMTTGEFSFILRQGKLAALSHPIQTAKALPNMFKALLASPEKSRAIDLETLSDPDADAARTAKLYLVEEVPSRLSRQEEIMMGRLVGKIPVVRNFNQAAQVFLNKVRMDMFKAMRKSLSKSGTPTPEEDRQIAMFVNEATGRGGLGKLEPAGVVLGRAMFAPKYYASRLQLAAGHSLWGGTPRTRRIIATEYARALVGLGLYYTALAMFFSDDDDEEKGEIGTDPRSTDFGKVKIGDTRLDPLAGLGQIAVLAARTGTGEKTTLAGEVQKIRGTEVPFGGDKWTDIVARHLRGKLHPVPSSVANLFDGTDMGGDEATVINQAGNMVAPITYIDIYAALKEQGLDDGAALALLALLGEGLQTYKKKE